MTNEIASGKTKTLYRTPDAVALRMVFRDDISAFNGAKLDQVSGKGEACCHVSAALFQQLEEVGVATHYVDHGGNTMAVRELEMLQVEVVVRNYVTDGLAKRMGMPKVQDYPMDRRDHLARLDPPVVEFFFKSDALGDPLVNRRHIRAFNLAEAQEVLFMEQQAAMANTLLTPRLYRLGLVLADFKLEFGRWKDPLGHVQLLVGDELSPDSMRLWDTETAACMDKDVFRHDHGDVGKVYQEVRARIVDGLR